MTSSPRPILTDILRDLIKALGTSTRPDSRDLLIYLGRFRTRYSHFSSPLFSFYLEAIIEVPETGKLAKDFQHQDLICMDYASAEDIPTILANLENQPLICKYSLRGYLQLVLSEIFVSQKGMIYDYIMIKYYQPLLLLRNVNRVSPDADGQTSIKNSWSLSLDLHVIREYVKNEMLTRLNADFLDTQLHQAQETIDQEIRKRTNQSLLILSLGAVSLVSLTYIAVEMARR